MGVGVPGYRHHENGTRGISNELLEHYAKFFEVSAIWLWRGDDGNIGSGNPPDACQTKEEVRAEIDRVDHALLTLFAERHRYVTRMAQIKTDPHEARDPTRIEAVIAKVRDRSLALDLDEDQAELVWRTLIDWNINYEKGIIAARRRG